MIRKYFVDGISCNNCKKIIEETVMKVSGIETATLDLKSNTLSIGGDIIDDNALGEVLQAEGYILQRKKVKILEGLLILMIIFSIIYFIRFFNVSYKFDNRIGNISALLFGLFTSLHCVSMCGSIALSRANTDNKLINLKSTLTYTFGRVLTYSLVGGLLGAFGNLISFNNHIKGFLFFLIALVMLGIGLKNLNIISFKLPTINFKKTDVVHFTNGRRNNFYVGVLNGFMPCGPLQTMYIFAMTGVGFINGFSYLFFFGIGTSILLLAFSNIGAILPKKHLYKVVKMSSVVIILMAIVIFTQGLNSFGIALPTFNSSVSNYAVIEDGYQIVHMEVDNYYSIEDIIVKKDIPVKLVINTTKLTPCNDTLTIPELDIIQVLTLGESQILFTPVHEGELVVTCWMNMLTDTIEVH